MNYIANSISSQTILNYLLLTVVVILIVTCFIVSRILIGGYSALTIKILATISVIMVAIYGIICSRQNDSFLFIILGFVFALVGDIMLDLKVVDRTHDKYFTNAGMGAFAFAHLMFLFSIIGISLKVKLLSPVLVSVAIAILISTIIMFVLAKPLKLNFGTYFWQSYIYSFILIFMVSFSVYLSFYVSKMWIFALGLSLFFASDLVLSTQYFGDKLDNKTLIIINHALYYLALIGIYSVIFFI